MINLNLEEMDSRKRVDVIFNLLTSGRDSDRMEAQNALEEEKLDFNRVDLRKRIISKLNDIEPNKTDKEEDSIKSWNKAWLLHTLGIISENDEATIEKIKEFLFNESNLEVRYWALGGLIRGKASDIEKIAKDIIEKKGEWSYLKQLAVAILAWKGEEKLPQGIAEEVKREKGEWSYVQQLAVAILAWKKDKELSERIKCELENQDLEQATLRALRFLYIPGTVEYLKKIVDDFRPLKELESSEKPSSLVYVYEAITALSQVPKDSMYAADVKQVLMKFITKHRQYGRCDGMRIKCFDILGNLEAHCAAPILIKELEDGNPAIIEKAAIALKKILGNRTATNRVVEAASKGQYSLSIEEEQYHFERYATALRCMDQSPVLEELEAIMVAGPTDQREVARRLLSEIGGLEAFQKLQARTKSISEHLKILKEAEKQVRDQFDESIKEARSGFELQKRMNTTVFSLGVFLVAVSALILLLKGDSLEKWVGAGATGMSGAFGILYETLIAKPEEKVNNNVDHMLKLKIIFLAYLRQLHQLDQSYASYLLGDELMSHDAISKFSDITKETMSNALKELRENDT
ncbi:MAG: hypothetical protein HXS54_17070 [Theionarchaea archaeon]|nr:hypothetical protein [Theionarchaea archaeon]